MEQSFKEVLKEILFLFLSHAKSPAASAIIGSSFNHSIKTPY